MRREIRAVMAWGSLVIGVAGCTGDGLPTDPVNTNPRALLARLELKHKAIVLSVHAPYDTIRLDAIARNLYSEEIPRTAALTFRRINLTDLAVSVDSAGLVRARTTTNGTHIEVALRMDGVVRADTATIMVRNEFPVQKIARLEFFPLSPDSAWRWAGNTTTVTLRNWVRLYNGQGQPISQSQSILTSLETRIFLSANPSVHSTPGGTTVEYANSIAYERQVVGETWLRVRMYAYDTAFVDSVLFRRVEPTVKFVVIDRIVPANGPPSIVFYPSHLDVNPGTTVIFMNRPGNGDRPNGTSQDFWGNRILRTTNQGTAQFVWVDSTGIVFDDATNVLAGHSYGRIGTKEYATAAASWPADGGTGNIPSFSWVRCEALDPTDATCFTYPSGLVDVGYRSRKFTTPGTYRYSSTAFPEATGTIVVRSTP